MKRFWLALGLMCWCTAAWSTAEVVLRYVVGNRGAYLRANIADAQVAFVTHKTQATPFTVDIAHGIGSRLCLFYLHDREHAIYMHVGQDENERLMLIPNGSPLAPEVGSLWTWRLKDRVASLREMQLIVEETS